ncbi:hypothetical protein ZWY2020_056356 [Hordeum vulgare]|nr:hypothetical protein ZWY2020_056356 [Hordeum vulgare]
MDSRPPPSRWPTSYAASTSGQMQPMPMVCLASSDEKLRPLHVQAAQVVQLPAARLPAEKHLAMPKSIYIRSKGYSSIACERRWLGEIIETQPSIPDSIPCCAPNP